MAIDESKSFDVDQNGVAIRDDNGDAIFYLTAGDGPPSGAAPVNSWYFDRISRLIYYKFGTGSSDWRQLRGDDIFFDPQTSGITQNQLGAALRELAATVGVSASPGYNFGRSSNVGSGTWLQTVGAVPSNKAGITVSLQNPSITQVFVANERLNTFDISVYEHEGDEINLTLLGTVSVVNQRAATFSVNYTATEGRQLAVQISSGTARNLNVGLQLKGST